VSLFLSKSVYYQNGSHRQQQPLNEKPTDTFAGEVVDQADVEFNKMSGGDDCISKKDAYKALESMMNEGGPMSPEEEQVFREHKAALKSEIKHNFHETDKDGDGCITRKEFKADNEMESPDTPAEMMGDAMQEPPMVPGEPEPGFAEVDKDQNGVLNTTEFAAFMNALRQTPSTLPMECLSTWMWMQTANSTKPNLNTHSSSSTKIQRNWRNSLRSITCSFKKKCRQLNST